MREQEPLSLEALAPEGDTFLKNQRFSHDKPVF
jgi:hypothetical protein